MWESLNRCSSGVSISMGDNIVGFAKILSIAAVGLLIATGIVYAGQQQSEQEEFAAVFSNLGDSQSPGASVLVHQNGQTLFERGYGLRDLRTRTAIDSHTNFRLASCTKQFTAMAIMLLVHDGKLRYEQRLTEFFPEFPDYGQPITIRNLLNHTSGLPDYESLMEKVSGDHPRWSADRQISDAEVLNLLEAQQRGKFAPGSRWSYSNSGYVLLGLVVTRVSGKPFEDFLHDRIFAPLGMNHTLAYVKGTNQISDRAYGYTRNGNQFIETDQSATSATLGDGGVYSNIEDLSKWDDALSHHTLLPASEMKAALTPVRLANGSLPTWTSDPDDTNPQVGKLVSYGFGWFLDDYKEHHRMWHYGETTGFRTAIERFTDNGLTIVILCNRSDLDPASMALKLANVALQSRNSPVHSVLPN
jgi:CubicO group peptidase (beta-lactamase class C family)